MVEVLEASQVAEILNPRFAIPDAPDYLAI
jgi:hypothetical protein